MASLKPPTDRTLLVAKVDVSVRYLGTTYALSANEFAGSVVDPRGFIHLESFTVLDGVPVWRYAVADALLEQRIFMAPGANTSYLRLELLRASGAMEIELKPLVTYRSYHEQGRGARPFKAIAGEGRCTIEAFTEAQPYRLAISAGKVHGGGYLVLELPASGRIRAGPRCARGFVGTGTVHRGTRGGTTPVLHRHRRGGGAGARRRRAHRPHRPIAAASRRLAGLRAALGTDPRHRLESVHRQARCSQVGWNGPRHWHYSRRVQEGHGPRRSDHDGRGGPRRGNPRRPGDRHRPGDQHHRRVSLVHRLGPGHHDRPAGLTTVLGRFEVASAVLRTYAGFVDGGMLPNRFPDAGDSLEYNTADATLWMFQALNDQLEAKRDPALLRDLFPTLTAIIHAHAEGTRYGIQVDPEDGLLHAGEAGMQLTWMDAKHGDQVFTPRIGKPVEINALWLNALEVMVRLAGRVRNAAEKRFCQDLLKRGSSSFQRFWNADKSCLFDVLHDGGAHDASIRPNQIFAVALPYSMLTPEQMRSVVDTCARDLLTSYGLRSLSADAAGFQGHYTGNSWQRDAAYHQGTVWSWLLGPFARAHHRVYGDAALAQSFLAPMAQHLANACVGSVSEIFDGDAPHIARGCFAQAWSVAEILRSWVYLDRKISKS